MDSDDDNDHFSDDESGGGSDDDASLDLDDGWVLQRIKENDRHTKRFSWSGDDATIQNITDVEWEEIGRDIANNTHLEYVNLIDGALNDHTMSSLFRGLAGSNSIKDMNLYENGLSVAGVRSMAPFLENANYLTRLDLDGNHIQSEGFNVLFRALRDSPIEMLRCGNCDIKSIEIDKNDVPNNLASLFLSSNRINSDGCRGL